MRRTPRPPPVVLITGCSSGIGRALAEEFLRRGQPVVATARRSADLAPLAALGATVAALDITDREAAENLLAVLAADGIEIDMLVNNAGFGAMGPLAEITDAQWQRQFDVNLFAPMALTRLVLPRMIARRTGCIVNIGSISGEVPTPFSGAYCASKAAFNAASDVLRMELAPFGVKVVSVLPGGIASSFGDTASAGATLAPGSAYAPWADAIAARARAGQQGAMPADTFARRVVALLLRRSPPPVIHLGTHARLLPAMKRALPRARLESILTRRFGLRGGTTAGQPIRTE